MKSILTPAILLIATVSIYGQQATTQCSVKVAQSPAVRGIKLGMKFDDVLALFPPDEENSYTKDIIANRNSFPYYGVINYVADPGDTKRKINSPELNRSVSCSSTTASCSTRFDTNGRLGRSWTISSAN
jgi:hypothetical protein